jgi:hypothetical protein
MQHDEWVPQKNYPVEIKPRTSETFFLNDMSTFHEAMGDTFAKQSIFGRWRNRFLKAYIVTDDGRRFKVQLGASLRKELRPLRTRRSAASASVSGGG